ncbi:MAG: Nudix family hydrolase [Gammaproteobacteria bacterium]|nr:Nudix family hydrolase [Gammaproteobacteria bacterium]
MNSEIHVAVAVIVDKACNVLITKRLDHVHQGGVWEFPGGKLESGERVQDALRREVEEEVGLWVQNAQPLITLHHDYGDKKVLLDVWRVTAFQGQVQGKEGQEWRWVSCSALRQYQFPAANQAIIDAVQLPEHYLITPEPGNDLSQFLNQFQATLNGYSHIELVQLRAKQLPKADYLQIAKSVIEICRAGDIRVLLNADPLLAADLGADGVHLSSRRLMALSSRPLSTRYWLAASCHNEMEIHHAAKIGVNFIVLAPVLATSSHPGALALGWEHFYDLVNASSVPVYALGGMAPEWVDKAKTFGAQGIAAISAFWQSTL